MDDLEELALLINSWMAGECPDQIVADKFEEMGLDRNAKAMREQSTLLPYDHVVRQRRKGTTNEW